MRGSDEAHPCNDSCSFSRVSPSEQRLSEPVAAANSTENLHRFNKNHAKIIPSLHATIPSGYKYLQIHTLTKETVTLAVHVKCRVQDAYLCCCAHLGFDEERLFGLAVRTPSEGIGGDRPRNEYFFLDPCRKITKYAPKQCTPAIRHYYLQLRENILDQWSGSNSVAEERCWELAALALHADENGNDLLSFRAEQYFPLWVVNIHGLDFVRRNMPAVRKDLRACSNQDAVVEYCQQASRLAATALADLLS
ncbi:unnamed protein product [Gongylonema pulchrum]|uniref:B41 domain-containing protein n=1 Tax=Gongylonema pulchrum TaxID=637853 RepID=A0A183CVJ0_9BILA|nr:unnamed protein product [Gongylonema pulchrum]